MDKQIYEDLLKSHDELLVALNEMQKKLNKTEKALDVACEKLSTVIDIEGCNMFCGVDMDNECACETKKYWKEWCMKNA